MCSIVTVASSSLWCCNYGTNKPSHSFSPLKSYLSLDNLGSFSYWSGLINPAIAIAPLHIKSVRRGNCTGRLLVRASLFGVGAPEVLVIGVVALLVFGPKGLAEVARNLGKTLQTFQPTIRELQQVSREFKSTLEQEIGLNELSNSIQNISSPTSNYSSGVVDKKPASDVNGESASNAYTSEEYLKITNEQLKALEKEDGTVQSEGNVESPQPPEKEKEV